MLKLYRLSIKTFYQLFVAVHLDIDFSENLTLGIKFEPQSLHWVKKQIIVHSGIVKCNGEKTYHPYVSDCKTHDQAFVKLVVTEMLDSTYMPDDAVILIESDNCSSQYKSCHHFVDMQDLADKFKRRVIRVFGIAGHGKGEVDHVGGVAKVAVRQEVAGGEIFTVASEVHDFLNNKFGEKEHPPYHLYQVNTAELETERKASAKIVYKTIPGSSSFHVIIFKPEAKVCKAASRLCLCESCQIDYGSCSLFQEYELRSQVVYPASLQPGIMPPIQHNNILEEIDDNNMAEVFIVPDTVVAVAAAPESVDTIWLIHVNTTNCISFKEENVDDYQHVIPPGINFNKGNFYERSSTNRDGTIYRLSKKEYILL